MEIVERNNTEVDGRCRGFGPDHSWTALHNVIDHFALVRPKAPALEDAGGCWSYDELRLFSVRAAAFFASHGLTTAALPAPAWGQRPTAPRPLAICMPRGRDLFALCFGAWRLGLPVVGLSCDMTDKAVERSRNAQALRDLNPIAIVCDAVEGPGLIHAAGCAETLIFDVAVVKAAVFDVTNVDAGPHMNDAGIDVEKIAVTTPASVLAYVYTGGTTKASKCVCVTHAMALWEAENYAVALGGIAGEGDKFLQYSSLFWGAAVLGQISIGLAAGGCICIGGCPNGCKGAGDALQQLAMDVRDFGITILGVVPSQLRGAWPGGPASAPPRLRALVLWADKCPVDLAREWRGAGVKTIDLLIASEYWLALYSDCQSYDDGGAEKHVYRKLPRLDARFIIINVNDDGFRDAEVGEVGEMYLAGPTTSPGYICADGIVTLEHHGASRLIDGRTYLRTRDLLRVLPDGGLVYSGRADSMMKHGGQWVDGDAIEDSMLAVPGVMQAAVISVPSGVDAFVVLHSADLTSSSESNVVEAGLSVAKRPRTLNHGMPAPFRSLAAVCRVLPGGGSGGCRIHLRTEMPLNPATGKIDRKALTSHLASVDNVRAKHLEEQSNVERGHVQCYVAWLYLAIVFVIAPQLTMSAYHLLSRALFGGCYTEHLIVLGRVGLACFMRLAAVAVLWVSMTFFEGRNSVALERLSQFLYRRGLPQQISRWLPFVVAAWFPVGWVVVLATSACSYLGWARERDVWLLLGFAGFTGVVADCFLLDNIHNHSAALGILGAITISMSSRRVEFASFLFATPGLFYQVAPKNLSDDFGYRVCTRLRSLGLRFCERLQVPARKSALVWRENAVAVDSGNAWDLVDLKGDRESNAWNSIGLEIRLHSSVASSKLLDGMLRPNGDSEMNGGSGSGLPSGTNESPNPSCSETFTDAGARAIAAIVERVCGGTCGNDALHGIDSMQAIQLSEAIRREFNKPVGVSEVLQCSSVNDLSKIVDAAAEAHQGPPSQDTKSKVISQSSASRSDSWRIWLCGMGPRMCTVDWLVTRPGGSKHLNVVALQRSIDSLVSRHSALRARNSSELPMFDSTYLAASLWQLWCSSGASWTNSKNLIGWAASSSVYATWPRSTVIPADEPKAKVSFLKPTVREVLGDKSWGSPSNDQRASWIGNALYDRRPVGPELFHICCIPVFAQVPAGAMPEDDAVNVASSLSKDEVQWYIYAVLDHGYCDGPTGLPLFADLLRLYGEESGETDTQPPTPAPDAFATLQRRLSQSLKPLPEAEHSNDDIFHDALVGWGYRRGYQRFLRFDHHLMELLRFASRQTLGCSVDVCWLAAISAAFFRMFPDLGRLDLFLVVTCRDKPTEELMVGYFSSRKLLPIEIGDTRTATILGLTNMISSIRRRRSWRRPRPFEKCSAIEVNIVSQVADGLPIGFREVRSARSAPRSWDRGTSSLMNLRLDQVDRDDWDFRLQSYDASWGPHWSTYFAQALGSVLVDMALRPTGPVVPPQA
eukprot:TRINITY_DN5326_c0_g1_i1.p1 TRINITY_DN5326_c0_g1~~TRINITY_DN5326_c0_g1_i1.p1  ORF type:complete len:1501 (+),score=265.11 TRINITY_DN5326_c0_g1_i1:51-4553(+)